MSLRWHCVVRSVLDFTTNQWTYYCKGNTLVPVLVATDWHIRSENITGGAIESSKSYTESSMYRLRHGSRLCVNGVCQWVLALLGWEQNKMLMSCTSWMKLRWTIQYGSDEEWYHLLKKEHCNLCCMLKDERRSCVQSGGEREIGA